MRTSPEIHFQIDRGIERAQRIEQTEKKLKEGDG